MPIGLAANRWLSHIPARALATLILALGMLAAHMAAGLGPARAQDDGLSTSYITPFPDNDVYRLQVIGDVMAEGLLFALNEAFSGDARVQMRKQQTLPGLIRFSPEDFGSFEEAIGREPLHVAVVMFGTADRIPLRAPGNRRVLVGSDEWKAEYGRRIDRIIRTLKRKGAAVYWVGLPIMRRPDMSEDVQMLNEVFRERALLGNIKFIDVYEAFADENGKYNQYGPDLSGKTRLLREADGISLTAAGNRKLAHFVEREIKRDLTFAKNERTIPLAGSEAEQRRISPKPTSPPQVGWSGTVAPAAKSKEPAKAVSGASSVQSAPTGPGELKADSSKVAIRVPGRLGREETINVEIVRPPIPASVVALMTRRESPDRASQLGDVVPGTLPGGTIVLNSITPGLAAGSLEQRRRLAPTQSPFFKVLVKGERLQSRPGRADDFRWPPPDAEIKPAEEPRPSQPRPSPGGPAPRS